ncbi:MAG: bifunctional glutamate N-acetyltransferase/amino-acid acetyltransferase ArgJ [Kofleriaceae bacterium]|nr:bifunctional glutamate N-acetyltransferase/amino-acid acetyltransferase ArgJ [Kofleriaceae bacterium]MBP6838032.1 bifunctional glutamate N-acetyltransferase/amino-acid acetyltransferase ArgJ [Kofleriaceae bacterium]
MTRSASPSAPPPALSCPGFRFAGIRAGIKSKDGLDLGLIACDAADGASAAAVFTRNRVAAAPVLLSRQVIRAGRKVRGVVVNSGNANACTGPTGLADARAMQAAAARALGVRPGEILVASTGVIGKPLPMPEVSAGITLAAADLSPTGFARFAEAIMTTDRRPKTARREVTLGGRTATLLGTTKGAGMIAPNMATTLTFVTADVALPTPTLRRAVALAVAPTFNALAVDGDTSTNDTLAVLCAPAEPRTRMLGVRDARAFTAALTDLLGDLARQLMTDGEGVHHVVTVEVTGAPSAAAAHKVAHRIATSPLVKTAIAGGDPNWGRVLCAVGNAGVAVRPERLALWLDAVEVARAGRAAPGFDEAAAAAVMAQPSYRLRVDLGLGRASTRFLACDLSHRYVEINADYRT